MSTVVQLVGGMYLVAIGMTEDSILWGLGPAAVGTVVFYFGIAGVMGWPI
ncbi:hypothetical protein [Mesorhizobium silamurunense]|nr:hypothetical protein [Mesorhizobium silamurunense]